MVHAERLPRTESLGVKPIQWVEVVGPKGQTGALFVKRLAQIPGLTVTGTDRQGNIFTYAAEPERPARPEVVIFAVPTHALPVALTAYSQSHPPEAVPPEERPTIILTQNGMRVIEDYFDLIPRGVDIVRGSLLTAVNILDRAAEMPRPQYNPNKLRIALAPFGLVDQAKMLAITMMFSQAGFSTKILENHRDMEAAKLQGNLIGATSDVTGLTMVQTFANPQLFAAEVHAIVARYKQLRREEIHVVDLPGIPLHLIVSIATALAPVAEYMPLPIRLRIAQEIVGERSGLIPATARNIQEGRPTEAADYHGPFNNPLDRAILNIIRQHENRDLIKELKEPGLDGARFDLRAMTADQRIELLLKTYNQFAED